MILSCPSSENMYLKEIYGHHGFIAIRNLAMTKTLRGEYC
jgi:hypothetical protein